MTAAATTASLGFPPAEVASALEGAAASPATSSKATSVPAAASSTATVSHCLQLRAHDLEYEKHKVSISLINFNILIKFVGNALNVTTSEDGIQTR